MRACCIVPRARTLPTASLPPRQPKLWNTTIRENVVYGVAAPVSDEQLADVATHATALSWIATLPAGFDTLVGDGGSRLSGGQRKTVAIARALLRRSQVLLCDEITSDLDPVRAQTVMRLLVALACDGRRTLLVITHQMELAVFAQRAFVLADGRVEHFEQMARPDRNMALRLGHRDTTRAQ